MRQTEANAVKSLLSKYDLLFIKSDSYTGRTGFANYSIDTGDNQPIKGVPRRLPEHMYAEVEAVFI